MPHLDQTSFRVLSDDELDLIAGGRTNGDNPFVQATMNAFHATTFCNGTSATGTVNIANPDGSVSNHSTVGFPNCSPA
jgi:hypothetical protein